MEDLSLHILDIVENATGAGATRVVIRIEVDRARDRLVLTIRDNGRGMDPQMAARAHDPFVTTRTTRRVGMGLPLLEQAAREADGQLEIRSTPGRGTEVVATFRHSHIDRRPLGDLAETMTTLILGHPGVDFRLEAVRDHAATHLDTAELRAQLEGVPLHHPAVLREIRKLLREAPAAQEEEGDG